jgi:cyclopropane fatty-acyl-phospholipid synthase-like methyltransferase
LTLRQIYDQAYFAYLYFWGGKKSGFINYGYWNDDINRPSNAHFLLFHKLFQLLKSDSPKSILDLGCGFGGASFHLAKITKAKITGITHSKKQIKICQQRCFDFKDRVNFIENDYHTFLNTTDQSFDLIWAVESIYHEKDKKLILEKLKNKLNPGRQLLVVDYYLNPNKGNTEDLQTWFEGYHIGEILTSSTFEKYCSELKFKTKHQLDWSIPILEGSRRIARLGKLSFPILSIFNKINLMSHDFLKGTKASIAQYDLIQRHAWSYKIYVLEKDN